MTDQTPVLFSVSWDTVIGMHGEGQDPDTGEMLGEQILLGDMVVEALVTRLAADIRRDAGGWGEELRRAREISADTIREETRAIVAKTLGGTIQQTDGYGRPKGDPITLLDLIREDVKRYLTEQPPSRGSGYRDGGFRELLRDEVDRALNNDLRDVIRQAREQVVETVKSKAVELFASLAKDGR